MDKTRVTKDLENNTLIIERIFDAPRQRVWEAYTVPEKFSAWWGPEGWETTVKEFNLIPGGKNHYAMKCVDKNQGEWFGKESWGMMVFEAVDAPNSFIYKDYFSDAEGTLNQEMPTMTIAMEFFDQDGATKMICRGTVGSKEQLEQLLNMGMVEGMASSLDKLGHFVEA